ncbi:MAG: hypothetical protein N2595_10550 [bacterium]|nr:hypothetical protein [bacterium]
MTHSLANLLALAICLFVPLARADVKRPYFIGNSLTDTLLYDTFVSFAASRGHTVDYGRHMIPGAPLDWLWAHPDQGFTRMPYGFPTNALRYYLWDALSLQCGTARYLVNETNYASLFINLGMPHNSNMQVYAYAVWPAIQWDLKYDYYTNPPPPRAYSQQWVRIYPGGEPGDSSNRTRDYNLKFTLALRSVWTNRLAKLVCLAPAGEIMYDLNQKMMAGHIPGYTNIFQLYADNEHLNSRGSYMCACMWYALLFREPPFGLPSSYYGLSQSDPLVPAIQTSVWQTLVTYQSYTGYIPEPSISFLITTALVWLRHLLWQSRMRP